MSDYKLGMVQYMENNTTNTSDRNTIPIKRVKIVTIYHEGNKSLMQLEQQ